MSQFFLIQCDHQFSILDVPRLDRTGKTKSNNEPKLSYKPFTYYVYLISVDLNHLPTTFFYVDLFNVLFDKLYICAL